MREIGDVREKHTVFFTYYGPRHKDGTYTFMMDWWQENFHQGPSWRGQMFRADPLPYIQKTREHGLTVVETRVSPL